MHGGWEKLGDLEAGRKIRAPRSMRVLEERLWTKPSTLTTGIFLLMYKIKEIRNTFVCLCYMKVVMTSCNKRTAYFSPLGFINRYLLITHRIIQYKVQS